MHNHLPLGGCWCRLHAGLCEDEGREVCGSDWDNLEGGVHVDDDLTNQLRLKNLMYLLGHNLGVVMLAASCLTSWCEPSSFPMLQALAVHRRACREDGNIAAARSILRGASQEDGAGQQSSTNSMYNSVTAAPKLPPFRGTATLQELAVLMQQAVAETPHFEYVVLIASSGCFCV